MIYAKETEEVLFLLISVSLLKPSSSGAHILVSTLWALETAEWLQRLSQEKTTPKCQLKQ